MKCFKNIEIKKIKMKNKKSRKKEEKKTILK